MKSQTSNKPYFSMALFALLVLATLALVLVGSRVYQMLVQGQSANANGRAVHAYLYSQLRASDHTGGVRLAAGPEGQALVLQETVEGTVYETRLYQYKNQLLEEYAAAGAPFAPERAQAVAKVTQFAVEQPQAGLLRVATNEGVLYLALRSTGGVAP